MLSFIASAGGAGGAFAGDAPLSLITRASPLSVVSGHLLSPIAGGSPFSAVLGHFLSLVAGVGPLSAVSSRLLSLVAGGDPLSVVSGGGLSSPVLPTSSRALFLTSTPSYTRCFSLSSLPLFHSFLPSLPTPLTRNLAPLTRKRLFD